MGLLGDFAGAFLSNVGNEMYDNERQQQALALQEALEARRVQREQERELRQRRNQNEDRATELNLQGPQIGVDDQGKQALLRVRAEVDPETAAIRGTRERVGDAPVTPVGRPFTVYDGTNRRSVQRYSDGSEKDLGAPSPVRAASGGGSGGGSSTKPKYELRNIGGEVMRINVNDPESKPQSMGPASKTGASKEDSADTIRSKWTAVATAINSAEGEALRSIAAQYGMDQRGLPTDDESLKSALLAQVDAEFGKRLKGGARAEQPKQKDAESPPVAGAKKAPDGFWYVQKDGKWFKVN